MYIFIYIKLYHILTYIMYYTHTYYALCTPTTYSRTQMVIELLIATTDTSSVSLFYLLYHLASDDGQV